MRPGSTKEGTATPSSGNAHRDSPFAKQGQEVFDRHVLGQRVRGRAEATPAFAQDRRATPRFAPDLVRFSERQQFLQVDAGVEAQPSPPLRLQSLRFHPGRVRLDRVQDIDPRPNEVIQQATDRAARVMEDEALGRHRMHASIVLVEVRPDRFTNLDGDMKGAVCNPRSSPKQKRSMYGAIGLTVVSTWWSFSASRRSNNARTRSGSHARSIANRS